MTYKTLFNFLEKLYPKNLSADFDNTGLNILSNDIDNKINNILICLEIIEDTIKFAIDNNVDLIISHHPVTFKSMKNILNDTNSQKIKSLINYGITAYSIHTNFDSKNEFGMGDIVTKQFDFKNINNIKTLDIINDSNDGLGKIVELNDYISIDFIIEQLINKFDIKERLITYYSNKNSNEKFIKKIAILPGSGRDYVNNLIDKDVDLYISSDLSHHDVLDLYENNISYINCTHYGLEKLFIYFIKDVLLNEYIDKDENINILIYENKDF